MVTSVQLENQIEKKRDRIRRLMSLLDYEYAYSATDRVRKDKGLIKKKSEFNRVQRTEAKIQKLEKELQNRREELHELESITPHKYTSRIER